MITTLFCGEERISLKVRSEVIWRVFSEHTVMFTQSKLGDGLLGFTIFLSIGKAFYLGNMFCLLIISATISLSIANNLGRKTYTILPGRNFVREWKK